MEILRVFDQFCLQNNVKYSLHGGTLLGAIREHGFIPWDDDADIMMTRDNFVKLANALSTDTLDYCIKGNIKKQFHKINDNQVWIDIFICDYISENSAHCKIKLFLLTALDIMYRDSESMKLSNLSKYSKPKQFLYKLVYSVGQIIPKNWISHWYASVSENWFQGNKKYIFRSNDQYIGRELALPIAWMKEYKYVQFENITLPVCGEYHAVLTQSYGENYMTPVQEDWNGQVHNLVRSGENIKL